MATIWERNEFLAIGEEEMNAFRNTCRKIAVLNRDRSIVERQHTLEFRAWRRESNVDFGIQHKRVFDVFH
ncbi:hypothetical protein M7I_6697 [Glarea lozoyensis 74030]|uniref:Uncharacterized protein n=1 Tax=Glarea lozoyensis (strain ATCC 74030 / MF5533) TaxID=1104152 RepID=H0EVA2_GLAL7|nr:hypothetical protein M7I_6697 [Glarea lozoyensis 74030]